MLTFINTQQDVAENRDLMTQMHHLRYRIFFEKLKWKVVVSHTQEKDEYDHKNTCYLVYTDEKKRVLGSLRFISMIYPTMFQGPFHSVLPSRDFFKKENVEISRMVVEDHPDIMSSACKKR